jgi:hypothetical protein
MRLRDFILGFMPPKMRAEAESESRRWIAACPTCQSANSVWDVGGMRYKAAGKPIKLAQCPNCRKIRLHRFEKLD